MGRVEAVKAGIMAFLESSADVEPSLPRASWFGGPTDYYLEVGMLVSGACCLAVVAEYGSGQRASHLTPSACAYDSAHADIAIPDWDLVLRVMRRRTA
jgi:hypothetical protein